MNILYREHISTPVATNGMFTRDYSVLMLYRSCERLGYFWGFLNTIPHNASSVTVNTR